MIFQGRSRWEKTGGENFNVEGGLRGRGKGKLQREIVNSSRVDNGQN